MGTVSWEAIKQDTAGNVEPGLSLVSAGSVAHSLPSTGSLWLTVIFCFSSRWAIVGLTDQWVHDKITQ